MVKVVKIILDCIELFNDFSMMPFRSTVASPW